MSGEMSLVERLISLAPDQLAGFRSIAGHGDGVSGSKRAARLIKDNLELIEAAIDAGVTRLAILNVINQSLPEEMQIKLSGFETARYRYRDRVEKENKAADLSTASVLVKNGSVSVENTDSSNGQTVSNPGQLKSLMENFDPDAIR